MSYSSRVKEFRECLQMTQGQFGELFELSTMQVSHIESGNREIKIELLNKMNNYGLNIDWLLTGQGKMLHSQETTISTHDSTRIPLLSVKASAGSGIVNYNEDELEWISVPTILLNQYNPKHVKLLEVHGDSMKPTFLDGDWILVSTNHKQLQSERVFVIRINDELKVKRLDRDIRGNIIIASDNPAFKTEELSPTEFTDFDVEIVGMVFGVLKKV